MKIIAKTKEEIWDGTPNERKLLGHTVTVFILRYQEGQPRGVLRGETFWRVSGQNPRVIRKFWGTHKDQDVARFLEVMGNRQKSGQLAFITIKGR